MSPRIDRKYLAHQSDHARSRSNRLADAIEDAGLDCQMSAEGENVVAIRLNWTDLDAWTEFFKGRSTT